MAIRLNVTATWADESEARPVFREMLGPQFDHISIESSGSWRFFTISAWSVSSSRLLDGLTRLRHLGIHAITVDAALWHLTLIVPGRSPVSFVHHFSLFGSDDDLMADEEPPQFEAFARDYADMGAPIADEFLDSVRGLTFQEALERFRDYETNRLIKALVDAGITFNHRILCDALLWTSTTPHEANWDIGNLPRVLVALGIKGTWQSYLELCEEPQSPENAFTSRSIREIDPALTLALTQAWEDPLSLRAYADRLDSQSAEVANVLKWYADRVMPVVKSITPAACQVTYLYWPWRKQSENKLRRHPQCQLLSQVSAIAFCRIPQIWQAIPESSRELLDAAILNSLGILDRQRFGELIDREKQTMHSDCALVYGRNSDPSRVNGISKNGRDVALKAVRTRNHFTGKEVSGCRIDINEQYSYYLTQLYEAVARVPALPRLD